LKTIAVEADTASWAAAFARVHGARADRRRRPSSTATTSGYSANREKATSGMVPKDFVDPAAAGAPRGFATPGIVTIAALAAAPLQRGADRQFQDARLHGRRASRS